MPSGPLRSHLPRRARRSWSIMPAGQNSRFIAGHFPKGFAISFFSAFNTVLQQELPEDYRKNAGSFGKKAAATLKTSSEGAGVSPEAETPLSPKARTFLKAVLAGDADRSRGVIEKALAAGTPVKEIYTDIFQPVLRETGRLWQQDEATIAQEHYVTGIVRGIMGQLHDRIAVTSGRSPKKSVVTACVGEELHEIGIRMVADFFVMDGWDVYSTGANTPAKSILAAVKEQKADVVALSITMPSRLSELEYLVRFAPCGYGNRRREDHCRGIPVHDPAGPRETDRGRCRCNGSRGCGGPRNPAHGQNHEEERDPGREKEVKTGDQSPL